MSLAFIAVGGNSLITDKNHMTVEDQYAAVCQTAEHIADLTATGMQVVVTHGNGPQVGFILRRSEIAREVAQMHLVPLVNCGADTQGAIGYQLQQALVNAFRARGITLEAATVVTQVLVDKDDPAFSKPAKPIGQFYNASEAEQLKSEHPDWTLVEDAGRGYRRVVASPLPKEIIEVNAVKALLKEKYCVIAAGGGGIPVLRNKDGALEGVDAVIDKDFASAFLARELQADYFIISTGVKEVCLNFGKANQSTLSKVDSDTMRGYMEEGHFAPGSMAPKIKAALDFLDKGGKEVIITSPENLKDAVINGSGTHIVRA